MSKVEDNPATHEAAWPMASIETRQWAVDMAMRLKPYTSAENVFALARKVAWEVTRAVNVASYAIPPAIEDNGDGVDATMIDRVATNWEGEGVPTKDWRVANGLDNID